MSTVPRRSRAPLVMYNLLKPYSGQDSSIQNPNDLLILLGTHTFGGMEVHSYGEQTVLIHKN